MCSPEPAARQLLWGHSSEELKVLSEQKSLERGRADASLRVWAGVNSSGSGSEREPGAAYKQLLFAVPDLNPSVALSGFNQHVFCSVCLLCGKAAGAWVLALGT